MLFDFLLNEAESTTRKGKVIPVLK